MADDADRAGDRIEFEEAVRERNAQQAASQFITGAPGECYYCGEDFKRVIDVVDPTTDDVVKSCGRCRDKRGLG